MEPRRRFAIGNENEFAESVAAFAGGQCFYARSQKLFRFDLNKEHFCRFDFSCSCIGVNCQRLLKHTACSFFFVPEIWIILISHRF